MKKQSQVSQLVRALLVVASVIYLGLCFLGALEISYDLHSLAVHSFILLALLLTVRQISLLLFAWLEKGSPPTDWPAKDDWQPIVSIIIPAYNEADVIVPAIKSLLAVDYENYEIIMVDDGSTDDTVALVRDTVANHNPLIIPVRIIAQSNSGKANALNTGLMHASGEFVLCVDSDSRITPKSLRNGLRHFQNPKIAAVAGNIVVANESNLLTRFQQLEYLVSQNFLRRGLALLGIVTVIPGPIGLFRKEALAQAHGYSEDKNMFAEDADLTVRLLALNWQITSDDAMQAITEAPDSINTLFRQRYRWKRGIYQVLHTNFFSLITAPGIRGISIALLLVFEGFLFEILGFGVTVFMLTNIILLGEVKLLIGWLILLFVLDLLVLLLATPLHQLPKWFPLLILQKLSYTFALQTWGVLALIDEWRSSKMSWDKVERIGVLHHGGNV